jgi:hypothetical protein
LLLIKNSLRIDKRKKFCSVSFFEVIVPSVHVILYRRNRDPLSSWWSSVARIIIDFLQARFSKFMRWRERETVFFFVNLRRCSCPRISCTFLLLSRLSSNRLSVCMLSFASLDVMDVTSNNSLMLTD